MSIFSVFDLLLWYILVEWRSDGRCGIKFPMNGKPGRCDPDANANEKGPCCSSLSWCGNTPAHCTCKGCIDFTKGDLLF